MVSVCVGWPDETHSFLRITVKTVPVGDRVMRSLFQKSSTGVGNVCLFPQFPFCVYVVAFCVVGVDGIILMLRFC